MRRAEFLLPIFILVLALSMLDILQNYSKIDDNDNITIFSESEIEETFELIETTKSVKTDTGYVLNMKSKKIHKTTCGTGDLILPENRCFYTGDIQSLLKQGYTQCGNCFK